MAPLAVGVLGLAVGALPTVYGAALVVGGAAALSTLVSPAIGLSALNLAIPFSPSGGSFARLPGTPTDALAILVLIAAGLAVLTRRQSTLTLTGAFWPGMAFILVVVLSASFAPDLATSAKELLRWVELLGLLVVTATFCQDRRRREGVLVGLFVAVTLEALLGWAQFFLRRGPPSFRIGPFLRAYGTFGQPNPFAGYFAMTLPVAIGVVLALYLARPARWARSWLFWLGLAAVGTGGVALLMSLSRGALVGVLGGMLVLGWLRLRRGGTLVAAVVGAAVLVLGLQTLHVLPSAVDARLTQIWTYVGWFDVSQVTPTPQNWAIIERMAHWQAAWNMYVAHPFLGVGPGHYAEAYPDYRVNNFWLDPLGHAHNLYLNLMAELGFFGILAYVVQWVAWAAVILSAYRRSRTDGDRWLAAGVLASLVAVAVHNVFDNLTVHGLNAQTGILIGLAAALGRDPATERVETG
jgi:putative inorganic carbon (HCO3(-)) transporter